MCRDLTGEGSHTNARTRVSYGTAYNRSFSMPADSPPCLIEFRTVPYDRNGVLTGFVPRGAACGGHAATPGSGGSAGVG